MIAQIIWPDHFLNMVKEFDGFGLTLRTNWAGFGFVIIGALLLAVAQLGTALLRKEP